MSLLSFLRSASSPILLKWLHWKYSVNRTLNTILTIDRSKLNRVQTNDTWICRIRELVVWRATGHLAGERPESEGGNNHSSPPTGGKITRCIVCVCVWMYVCACVLWFCCQKLGRIPVVTFQKQFTIMYRLSLVTFRPFSDVLNDS